MADTRQDWLVAAACCESPRPAVTLADLPRVHRDELIRFALVAAAASVFFITVTILLRPLPSRSLASAGALPHQIPPAGVFPVRLQNPSGARPPQTSRRRAESLPAASETVSVEERPTAAPPRRRGGVSRFFRGVFR
jgi:hypothetical protein